ncbi:MAG: hypothetical protein J6T41_07050, partial [Neisseriaceae bacterium]|nr:hypothetical protein [Neisseriaceae bacterium]
MSGYYDTTGGAGRAIAIGQESQAVREGAIAVGWKAMAGENAIAIGNSITRAVTPNSIAIGYEADIHGQGALNTSLDDPKQGGNSIAFGNGASNFTYADASKGNDYYANTKNSIAIGYKAHTHAANAFAIGVSTDAIAERAFAIGTSYTDVAGGHQGSLAAGQGSVVIGDQARSVYAARSGYSNDVETNTDVNDSVAIGTGSLVSARNALALGGGISYTYHDISTDDNGSKTMKNKTQYYFDTNTGGVWKDKVEMETGDSIGAKVDKGADGAIALGGASADITYAVDETAYPTNALTNSDVDRYVEAAQVGERAKRSIAIGGGTFVGNDAEGSVAIGGKGLDAATKSTIGANAHNALAMIGGTVANGAENAIAVGNNAKSDIKNAIAFGTGAHAIGEGDYPAIAMGQNANATKARTIAIGQDSKALSNGSVTIGYNAQSGTVDAYSNSVAIGQNATSTALETVAIGGASANGDPNSVTLATEKGTIAIGGRAQSTKDQAISIGQNTNAGNLGARQSIAIGAETQSTGIASIAIGGDDIDNKAQGGTSLDPD